MITGAPIFILGTGRSGSSLLRAMLDAHPAIHLVQEASFQVWTTPTRRRPTPEQRLQAFLASFSFAWLRVDPAALLHGVPRPVSEADLPDIYERLLRMVAERNGARRFGEKNPVLADSLATLYERWPDARVVFIVRDPRACALSHTRMPWSTGSLSIVAHLIRIQVARALPWADRIHWVRLEDLLADREGTLRGVLDYVGEPWDPRVLDHESHIPPDDGIPFPWLLPAHRNQDRPRQPWSEALPPPWIRLIESVDREIMTRFDYAPAALRREPRFGEGTLAVLRDLPEAIRYVLRAARLRRRLRRDPLPGVAEVQERMLGLNPRARARTGWEVPAPPDSYSGSESPSGSSTVDRS